MHIISRFDRITPDRGYVCIATEYWAEEGYPERYWEQPHNKVKPYATIYSYLKYGLWRANTFVSELKLTIVEEGGKQRQCAMVTCVTNITDKDSRIALKYNIAKEILDSLVKN